MLQALFSGFSDFLFPKDASVSELESMSPGELLSHLSAPHSFSGVGSDTIALFAYPDERVRQAVWELKYRRNEKLAQSLAVVLYDTLQQELADRALFDNFRKPLLIPMPMSRKRRRERGWNQTEVLCKELVRLAGEDLFEYRPDILHKVRHTESQTLTQNKKERLRNIEGSMQAESVSGRNIILIDDVTTTGATFRDARRALRESGARKILCIALAH